MGKVKKRSSRVHIPAVQVSDNCTNGCSTLNVSGLPSEIPKLLPIPVDILSRDPFIAFNKKDQEMKSVKEDDKKQTTICNDSTKIRIIKRDKRKQRHKAWLEKIEGCRKAEEEKKAAQKRKNTVIVGDLRPLLSSLPEPTTEIKKNTVNTGKPKPVQNTFKEVHHFKDVLDHPAFVVNPLGTISDHIKNLLALKNL